jgi:hypothetical protein
LPTTEKLKLELIEDYELNDQNQLVQIGFALQRLGVFFAHSVGHLYHNLLICLGPDFPCVGHPVVDFIGFFCEVVGDPGLPI